MVGFRKGSVLTTLAGGVWVSATLTVLKVGSCGRSRVLAINNASNRLNRSDHFWSSSANLESVEEDVSGRLEAGFSWLVQVEASGHLEDDFTALSGLTDLEDVDFLPSAFLFFSAGGALKPGDLEVFWPSTTPTTDTSARSTRLGLRVLVKGSLAGVEDMASRLSFFNL